MTDGMFTVSLVPREMMMATIRWMGLGEAEVVLMEGMYKLVDPGMLDEFSVNIGLRRGSSLTLSCSSW